MGRLITSLKLLLITISMLFYGPVSAQAQSWRFEREVNQYLFSASIQSTDGSGFSLTCGEQMIRPPGNIPTFYEGWTITRPNALRLVLSEGQIGPSPNQNGRNDVLIAIGPDAYRLPNVIWDDLYGDWSVDIQATGPMFDAIMTAPSFDIHSDAGVLTVPGNGFAAAYTNLLNNCRSLFGAIGKPWLPGPPAPPPAPVTMRQAAEAAVVKGCNGASTFEPGAFLSGDIDGDGVPDVVLDWGSIACAQPPARPYCGASRCSAFVFLSQRFPLRPKPIDILGLGVRLQPLSNGNMAVASGGSLMECRSVGLDGCEFLFYWNGADLVPLQ